MTHLPSLAGLGLHRIVSTSGLFGPDEKKRTIESTVEEMVAILKRETDHKRAPRETLVRLTDTADDKLEHLADIPHNKLHQMQNILDLELEELWYSREDIDNLAKKATLVTNLMYDKFYVNPFAADVAADVVADELVKRAKQNNGWNKYVYFYCLGATHRSQTRNYFSLFKIRYYAF